MSALQHAAILLSHVAYLPVIVVAARRRDLSDFVVFASVMIISLTYHASDAGLEPFGSADILQSTDNLTVWDTLLWGYISSIGLPASVAWPIWFAVSRLFVIFPRLLIDTFVFQLTFLPTAILVQIACVLLFRLPPPRYNHVALGIGVVIFSAGLPFLYFDPYYTLHPIWHLGSGIGGYFVYFGFRNLSLLRPLAGPDEIKYKK